ncbi:MAG: hypothetical protein VX438_07600, partial [Planctomycetota bacterium]|nr:hypothetical protein [Planctomycetota bacterium]
MPDNPTELQEEKEKLQAGSSQESSETPAAENNAEESGVSQESHSEMVDPKVESDAGAVETIPGSA